MQYDTTRTYLARVLPWVQGGYVSVHNTVPNKKFDPSQPVTKLNKPHFLNGRAFVTLDEIVKQIAYISTRPDTLDIYVCMASQKQVREQQTVRGATILQPMRLADMTAAHKALYMDLDVKPNSPESYPTRAELIADFTRFMKEVGLPVPTLMVSSGTGGAHAYWCLDRVITREEWQPLANALAEATRRHNFKCDTQCIVDCVRILRPPETWNRKTGTPLPVTMAPRVQPADISVEHMRKVLTPYFGAQVIPLRPGMGAHANDELSAGISTALAKPIDVASVEKHCGFVRNALATGGKSYAQPLWNISVLLSTFMVSGTEDGRAIAHRMSSGHPGYNVANTDDLYNRKEQERQARNVGWPSCNAVANAGCTDCATCPLKPLQKYPLSYGVAYVSPGPAPTSAPVVPISAPSAAPQNTAALATGLPDGYICAKDDGRIYKIIAQPDGTMARTLVSPYPMHGAYLQSNPFTLHFYAKLDQKHDTHISIQLANLQSREYGKHIAGQGIVTVKQQTSELQEFLLSWVSFLQGLRATIHSSPFGWSVRNGKTDGFVYGGKNNTPTGSSPAAMAHEVLREQYTPVGDLQAWKNAADFITQQNRPDLAAILACSFGAPLMKFTGEKGVIVSAYSSESGIGKSTSMIVGQSVWGHPNKGMNSLEDTQNSVINKAGQLRSLPLYWDEMKGTDQKQRFARVAFQITEGKEKGRLNQDSSQRDPGTWQTMVVCASNDSLFDVVQREFRTTEAGMLRVFEFKVQKARTASQHSHGYASRLIGRLSDNYGMAGLEYAKFLGANHEQIKNDMAQLQDKLIAVLGLKQEERFWTAAICCMLCGAHYANKLGLTKFNEQHLRQFLFDTLKELRGMRLTTAVDMSRPDALVAILANYLNEMSGRFTLVTDHIPQGRGRPAPCNIMNAPDAPRIETVMVRHALKDKIIAVNQQDFMDWMHRKQISPFSVVEALQRVFSVRIIQRCLAAGTDRHDAGFRVNCLEINYAGTAFDSLIDRGD